MGDRATHILYRIMLDRAPDRITVVMGSRRADTT